MIQHIIIALLFLAALAYVGYIIYKSFQAGSGCSSGCGSCGIDLRKIEKDLQKKGMKL
jgi:hypothetical protein